LSPNSIAAPEFPFSIDGTPPAAAAASTTADVIATQLEQIYGEQGRRR
jgi:hypothetical protein